MLAKSLQEEQEQLNLANNQCVAILFSFTNTATITFIPGLNGFTSFPIKGCILNQNVNKASNHGRRTTVESRDFHARRAWPDQLPCKFTISCDCIFLVNVFVYIFRDLEKFQLRLTMKNLNQQMEATVVETRQPRDTRSQLIFPSLGSPKAPNFSNSKKWAAVS